MDVQSFENRRWSLFQQSIEFRHKASLSLINAGPVLDIGCGDGLLLSLLSEKSITAQGVDISDEAVKVCKSHGFDAQVIESGEKLPFPDGSFEYVVMLDILEHVYDPLPFLTEAKRVSNKYVIVGVPNFSSLPARMQVLLGRVPENNRPNKGHIFWFNYSVLKDIVAKSGLSIARESMNTFSPASFFGNFFVTLLPNLFALSFVVQLEKK